MKQFVVVLLLALCVSPAAAQEPPAHALLPADYVGPPAPERPATAARDAEGHVTVRAIRLPVPLRVDGRLDEAVYGEYRPMTDFIQTEPSAGEAATEKTEVWVTFDADNVYVTVRAWESQPERMIVNEMRRDSTNIFQNENFLFAFDTFYDRRNSVAFQFNPVGGRMDAQVANESQYNGDWNPVWTLAVSRFDGGWSGEAAVPFKSLRYRPGVAQLWGLQFRRINRWKNEVSYLTRVPDGSGNNGFQRASSYATLVGLEAPTGARTLDLKPYVVSDVTTNTTSVPRVSNDPSADFGLDAKYTVTQNLTADFTYNTDFAQVEADESQVNLTRFNLFFPEKREFFLENQGLFLFGGANTNNTGDTPTMFYSRRIGLDQGRLVPIEVGGRLTGQVGAYSVGLINIQTESDDVTRTPGANFTVARVRRDILRKSAVGLIYTRRSEMANGAGANDAFGIDGRLAFYENLTFNTYWAKTHTPGLRGHDTSHRVQMQYDADRYGLTVNHMRIGDHFNPDVGFVRRDNIWRQWIQGRFSPRPANIEAVRKFTMEGTLTYITNARTGMLETRTQRAMFNTQFQNSDEFELEYEQGYEGFTEPFRIATGVTIPAGGYDLATLKASWLFGRQRRAAGQWYVEGGPFYDGDRVGIGYSTARVNLTSQLAVEPGFSVNKVQLPYGDFTATVINTRTTFTVTPMMFVSGLVQYSSGNNAVAANVRFRWEYLPGSELFVVYNEGRDTSVRGFPDVQNRAVVVKVNRLFRF
jgi:hypothetical protein